MHVFSVTGWRGRRFRLLAARGGRGPNPVGGYRRSRDSRTRYGEEADHIVQHWRVAGERARWRLGR